MSSLVQSLQRDIVEGKKSITQLLRQTELLAAKANLADVEKWVDCELNGYEGDEELPAYRHVYTNALQIYNQFQGGWRFAGNLQQKIPIYHPISQVEDLAEGEVLCLAVKNNFKITDQIGSNILSDLPQRLIISG